MRTCFGCLAALCLFVLAFASLIHPRRAKPPFPTPLPTGHPLTTPFPTDHVLLLTGEELGYLEPCGCAEGLLGGIMRRHSYLTFLRRQGVTVQLLHCGDVVSPSDPLASIKRQALRQAFSQMDFTAFAIGEKDLDSIFFWRSLGIPLILTNGSGLSPSHTFSTPFGPLAVYSLLSPSRASFYAAQVGLSLFEPSQSLAKAISPTTKGFLVYHGPKEELKHLLQQFPQLIGGVAICRSVRPQIERHGHQWLLTLSRQGTHLLLLWMDRQGIQKVTFVPLDESIPDSPMMLTLYRRYLEEVRRSGLALQLASSQPLEGNTFVGNKACQACHLQAYRQWQQTRHSRAFDTLLRKRQEKNPECLRCHTVGYPFVSGFVSEGLTPEKKHVGCESCHGPGSGHVAKPERGYGKVTKKHCLQCHTRENSPRRWQQLQSLPKLDLERHFPWLVHKEKRR